MIQSAGTWSPFLRYITSSITSVLDKTSCSSPSLTAIVFILLTIESFSTKSLALISWIKPITELAVITPRNKSWLNLPAKHTKTTKTYNKTLKNVKKLSYTILPYDFVTFFLVLLINPSFVLTRTSSLESPLSQEVCALSKFSSFLLKIRAFFSAFLFWIVGFFFSLVFFIHYSLLNAITGSFLAAFLAGIIPETNAKIPEIIISIIAAKISKLAIWPIL